MQNLSDRQNKIQELRKKTPWREFVMEICSWRNLMLYRSKKGITKFPQCGHREMNLITLEEKAEQGNDVVYSLDIDPSIPFLDQFDYIYHNHPFPLVNHYGLQENANWGDEVRGAKNVYLSVAVGDTAENVLYTFKGETQVDTIVNCINITQNCSIIYNSKTVRNSFKIFYSKYIYNSNNIWFCDNMVGCSECMLSEGLVNKKYYIRNVEYTKAEYLSKKKEILKEKELFSRYYEALSVSGENKLCENVSGFTLFNCRNVENAYELSNLNNARNIIYCDGGGDSSDCFDVIDSASDRTHHLYGVMGQAFGDHVYCSGNIVESSYIYYSFMLLNCTYCLGCVQLTNKSYCIFNKQYTKEERHKEVDAIFARMEQEGTLGKFYKPESNPFYFNDTAAYLIDPTFTKEEVEEAGYMRRDEPIKVDIPPGVQTLSSLDLGSYESRSPLGKREINVEILKKVIIDEQGNAYRIIPMEYEFLVKYGLPIPRTHWLERMKENFRIN